MGFMIGRRALVASLVAGAAVPASALPPQPRTEAGEWQRFKSRFMRDDGRLVDTGNDGVSHSESQGYGLLLAAAHDDREAFDRILSWSRTNLAIRRDDSLMAWRYRHGASNPVEDRNNATDGDLMFAWACARAHDRWGVPEHLALARTIARDMLRVLSVQHDGRRYMLPGAYGFSHGDRIVLNPSYHIVPALRRMALLFPDPAWAAVMKGGDEVLVASRRGTWSLPPDWAQVSRFGAGTGPSISNPQRFGYDAVRVPLNLVWGGDEGSATLNSIHSFWSGNAGRMPGWVDLRTGSFSPEAASDGYRAIAQLTAASLGGWRQPMTVARVERAYDYYSASLVMLVRLAASDLGKRQPNSF